MNNSLIFLIIKKFEDRRGEEVCNIWNFGGRRRMWMWERKQISFNSFEDTLELVKPAEKFDGFENQVISENQQCGSLEEVEDGAHGGGGGGKQGVLHKEFQTPEENFLQKWKLKVRKKLIWTSRKDTKWRRRRRRWWNFGGFLAFILSIWRIRKLPIFLNMAGVWLCYIYTQWS